MNVKVNYVEPLEDYQLYLEFNDGSKKVFDIKPFLDVGDYKELKDKNVFNTAKLFLSSIQWDNGLDIDPEFLYVESTVVDVRRSANA